MSSMQRIRWVLGILFQVSAYVLIAKEPIPKLYSEEDLLVSLGEIVVKGEQIEIQAKKNTILLKIPKGGNDSNDRSKWKNRQSGKVGDIFRIAGGQHNLYWEVLEIQDDKVKFRRLGFIFRIGTVDEVFWLHVGDSEKR